MTAVGLVVWSPHVLHYIYRAELQGPAAQVLCVRRETNTRGAGMADCAEPAAYCRYVAVRGQASAPQLLAPQRIAVSLVELIVINCVELIVLN